MLPVKTVQTKFILVRKGSLCDLGSWWTNSKGHQTQLIAMNAYSEIEFWLASKSRNQDIFYLLFSWEWASSTIHLPPLHMRWRHHICWADLVVKGLQVIYSIQVVKFLRLPTMKLKIQSSVNQFGVIRHMHIIHIIYSKFICTSSGWFIVRI
jgi:hypothetical protein